jgi:hypothetical protein
MRIDGELNVDVDPGTRVLRLRLKPSFIAP